MPKLLSPRYWGGHLLGAAAVLAAVLLGLWQLEAWQAHREAEARDLTQAAPRPLLDVMDGDTAFPGEHLGRPVALTGTWLETDTLFVADRRLDGKDGYWVVTPVAVAGTDSAMPVVRGWSAQPEAPDLPDPTAEVTGWLQAGEGAGLIDEETDDRVIPEMRIASLVELVDADLFSGFVVTRSAVEPGLAQVTPDSIPKVSSTTALRNLLYAIEWWVFAAFALFIWVRWCRDELAPRPHAEAASIGSAP